MRAKRSSMSRPEVRSGRPKKNNAKTAFLVFIAFDHKDFKQAVKIKTKDFYTSAHIRIRL